MNTQIEALKIELELARTEPNLNYEVSICVGITELERWQ
jgi:hypothetical protein